MNRPSEREARRSAAAWLLMACVAAAWAAPAAAQALGDPPPVTREAIWRSIFARPGLDPGAEDAKAALGRDLFYDTRLSGSGSASCASCHEPTRAFTDGRKTAVGANGTVLSRNAPSLFNLAWAKSFFWDGRAASLAEQAKVPIEAPDEMAGDFAVIAETLAADTAMRQRFAAAFPAANGVTQDAILEALTAYERSLVSPETRFDRWIAGEANALSPQEVEGFGLFVGKAGCVSCHGGWRFTDDDFHDVGLPGSDLGRGALPGQARGLPEFRTPSLREATHTAPYMHDGSLATLEAVVDHYAGDLVKRPSLAPTLVADLKLTGAEKAALVAFLRTLSSEQEAVPAR